MKLIFLLTKDYPQIGKEEVISLFSPKKFESYENLMILEANFDLKIAKRLSIAKSIYSFVFDCKAKELTKQVMSFDWNKIYKKNFCVRVHNIKEVSTTTKDFIKEISVNKSSKKTKIDLNFKNADKISDEKRFANIIWDKIKNPKVDLQNPKTEINFFFYEKKVYCGLKLFENNDDFESRKSHKRPYPHPSSLHPKIAKALVNLTEVKNEAFIDPMCGTGGFLIEAGLMGINAKGYDLNKELIEGCKENMKFFKVKCKVERKNALKMKDKFDFAATDLPYGLNSNACSDESDWKDSRINQKIESENFQKNIEKFYLDFLKTLRKCLKKKAVIVFPHYADYRLLLKKAGFTIEKEFTQYVHGSLSRKIVKVN